jgi:Flp pilus assembly protein TadD
MSDRRLFTAALVALIAVGVFWGLVWRDLDRSVQFRVPLLDEAYYLDQAAEIAAGNRVPDHAFFMSPLYPYLVAWSGGGRHVDLDSPLIANPPYGIRVLQLLGWLGILGLLTIVGRRLIPGRFFWLPALLFLLYRPAAILTSSILLEIPLTFLAVLSLYLLGRRDAATRGWRLPVLIGVLIACAGLLRGVGLLIWILAAWRFRKSGLRPLLQLTLAMILVLLPVVLHNSLQTGRPAALSLNLGLNAYLGNGPGATGGFHVLKGRDTSHDPEGMEYLSRTTGSPVRDLGTADRLWLSLTIEHVKAHPTDAAKLLLRKLRLYFAGLEYPQITDYQRWVQAAPALRLLFLPWWLLSVLGLVGLGLYGRRAGRTRLWSASLILLVLVHAVFFVATRYRLIMVPGLAVFASMFIVRIAHESRRRQLLAAGLLILALFIVQPWGFSTEKRQLHRTGLRNEAAHWSYLAHGTDDPAESREAWRETERLYRQSMTEFPEDAAGYSGLARALSLQKKSAAAEAVLHQGVTQADETYILHADLVMLYLQEGRTAEAVPILNILVRDHPGNADYLHNYSVALAGTGRLDAAADAAQRLTAAAPHDPRGYIDLGVILARAGRREEAQSVFQAGLEAVPGNQDLQRNLELLSPSE